MRSLYALNPRGGAAEDTHLVGKIFFCLTGVLTNTKYVHLYLQQQAREHSAVEATKAKSFETSVFQHKFHKDDRLSQSNSSQLLSPTTYVSQLSQTRTSHWRRLVHNQISDCDIKIHPRIYSGTIHCLLAVLCPVQMHSLHNSEPILTTLNNFLPPNGSIVYSSQCIAEEIFNSILEYPSCSFILQSHLLSQQSF